MLKLNPFPYQRDGINFINSAINLCGSAFIGDQPGLGKTIQGLGYTSDHNLKTLILCPSYLKYNWKEEIEKFTYKSSKIINCSDKLSSLNDLSEDYIIVNYDITHKDKIYPFLYHSNFDAIICDESHYLKNYKAKRTQYSIELVKHIPKRIFLSGTPIKSNPEEFFTQLHALRPDIFSKYGDYKKYCSNNQSYEELHKIISKFYLRRLKKDVLPDLPDVLTQTIPLELSNEELSFYNSILNVKNTGKGEILVALQRSRQFLADIKFNSVCEMIDDLIHQGEKVVVFSQHTRSLLNLQSRYGVKCVLHKGNISDEVKQLNINQFKNDTNVQILAANTMTAVGYNAVSSSHAIFIDLPWTPADLQQSIDRLHRIGQKHSVKIMIPLFKNTIDEKIYELLKIKEKIVNKVINLEHVKVTTTSIQPELINELMKISA